MIAVIKSKPFLPPNVLVALVSSVFNSQASKVSKAFERCSKSHINCCRYEYFFDSFHAWAGRYKRGGGEGEMSASDDVVTEL